MRKQIGLSNSPAKRFSKQTHHNSYGIYNFLNKKGINHPDKQSEIIEQFLSEQKFVSVIGGKKLNKMKLSFIQNRFSKFSAFVNKLTPQK